MRHPGFMAAFADRVGDIDDLSGFIVVFLVVTVVSCFWNDITKHSHPQARPAGLERVENPANGEKQDGDRQNDDKLERI